MRVCALFLALLTLTVSCARDRNTQQDGRVTNPPVPASAPAAAPPEGPPNPINNGGPTKLALLVGINEYKYPDRVSPLAGSINDVEDMKAILVGKFEFPSENILVLKDGQATHAGIIAAIQTHLIAKAKKDDIVVFHYSGHGSQMKDVTGKKISGLDETIVPYDSRDPDGQVFDISGAELHGLLLQLAAKTKNITFILDSCHSGTLVRAARAARIRSIPPDERKPPERLPSYAIVTRNLGEAGADPAIRYAFIAATTSRENAFEHFADAKEHGALTYFLGRQLRNAGAGATYRDIMDNVSGMVTANYPSQHPQLESAGADQFVFGDASSLSRTFINSSPLRPSFVLLAAGEVQGVSMDSVYDVYRPGSKKFAQPEKPIASVQITKVDPFTSEAKIMSGANIPAFSRAIEKEHGYGSRRLRVYFDGLEASPRLQSINAALTSQPYVEMVNDPAICHVQIRETGNKVMTLAADATTLSPPVPSDAPNLVDRLTQQIKGWAKWFNILGINNPQSDLEIQFSIKASETRDPLARVGKPDAGLFEGEHIDVNVKNASAKDLYVSILDLSSDGSISIIYPQIAGSSEVLTPGSTLTQTFRTEVPKGRSVVSDVLKVFASTKPIDLSALRDGPIREIPPDAGPLQALLQDAAGSLRSVVPVGSKVSSGGWATAQRVIIIKRRR
jgi:Caspase domain